LRKKRFLLILIALAIATLITAPTIGSANIPPKLVVKAILKSISNEELELEESIVVSIRIPRVVMGMLVGSALATAGVVMQAIFRNPMADPFILGLSPGAAVGAILGMILAFNVYAISFSAFLTSLMVVFAVYNLAKVSGRITTESLLLAGIAVSFFLYAVEWLLLIRTNAHMIISWLIGYLGNVGWLEVKISIIPIIAGIFVVWAFARDMNAMLFGEETAHYLGIDVEHIRKILLVVASLITAISASFVGVIGFVGLMVPHIVRMIVGADHRVLIPSSALFGGIFLSTDGRYNLNLIRE
jgi:iron complex transport system permease protein